MEWDGCRVEQLSYIWPVNMFSITVITIMWTDVYSRAIIPDWHNYERIIAFPRWKERLSQIVGPDVNQPLNIRRGRITGKLGFISPSIIEWLKAGTDNRENFWESEKNEWEMYIYNRSRIYKWVGCRLRKFAYYGVFT